MGVEVELHAVLTLEQDGRELSVSCLAFVTPGDIANSTHYKGR